MRSFITSILLLCATITIAAPPPPPPVATGPATPAAPTKLDAAEAPSFFERISISPFASYRVHEFGQFNGKLGGGLAAGFAITPRLTLEAEVLAERFDDSHWLDSLTEAGANFKFYVLKPGSRLNPYALIGYTRNLDFDQNRMNAGAGLEVRLGDHASVFADGRWTHDFGTTEPVSLGHAMFRGGLNWRF